MGAYPLEAARTLRREEAEQAEARLSAEKVQLEASEAALRGAQENLTVFRQESSAIAKRQRQEDDRGRSLAEMERARLYLGRREREAEPLHEAVAQAQAERRIAHGAVEQARGELMAAKADQEVIEKHFDKWREQQKKAADKRQEDEQEDLTTARSGRPARGSNWE